jgi:hypothetical protein
MLKHLIYIVTTALKRIKQIQLECKRHKCGVVLVIWVGPMTMRHRSPQVADGVAGLQIWRTAENTLKNQSRMLDKS